MACAYTLKKTPQSIEGGVVTHYYYEKVSKFKPNVENKIFQYFILTYQYDHTKHINMT